MKISPPRVTLITIGSSAVDSAVLDSGSRMRMASAIDAIQVMLVATLGNQRLHVMDYGKRNYTVLPHDGKGGFKLSFRPPTFWGEDEYDALEEKIRRQQGTLEEIVHFQELLQTPMKLMALETVL